jgi:amino acid adenylation domain-containing protein
MIRPKSTQRDWASLVEVLRCRAEERSDEELFAFLPDGEDVEAVTMTRGELDRRARTLAVRLQERGVAGERALLLYPSGLDFIAAFFGCLYAGVVAVPAHLPRLNRPMTRLQSIVTDAAPRVVLTTASQGKDAARWSAGVPELQGVEVICSDEWTDNRELADRWADPGATAGSLAFLQYTSGSTATPRGVMITHGNLLDNSACIWTAFALPNEGRGVFWLPFFHDMGLIGGIIQTLYCGGASTLLSPVSFLQRPLRWLQVISRSRAIISGGPNFAYDLCVEKTTPEQRAELDLSCWRVAFNGAEPVRAQTLDRFVEAFAPAGFRPEAFLPCYGMAEATLLVSATPAERAPVVLTADAQSLGRGEIAEAVAERAATRLVSSGRTVPGHVVAVVDATTCCPCADNRVGEIWVSGPSIAQGYWNRPEQSRDIMGARLDGDADRVFLRTGDLGFLRDGELFVTGRIKDMMILRGKNVYPQDVEWAAESSHQALRAGGVAAFSIDSGGEERLVIVVEVERRLKGGAAEEIIAAVGREVALALDLEVFAIRLIKTTSLPRTSSGKIQRHACREAFVDGSLETVAAWTRPEIATAPASEAKPEASMPRGRSSGHPQSRDAITTWLAAKVAALLGIRPDDVDIRAPLAGFGMGSLHAVRLAGELEEWLGRKLSATLVYDYPTIDTLAGFLAGESTGGEPVRFASSSAQSGREPIAIIGIGCRFPGADGPTAFWELLRIGTEAIGEVPDSRWTEADLQGLDFPRRSGFLKSIDRFDASFFRIAPREAIFLDPQQRMLLEVAWEALEDAGQVPERLAGRPVGVFIGISTNDYAFIQVKRGGAAIGHRVTGNSGSIAANRISHFLDFRGPSLAIDTACSSSLVATHLACRSIWDGESELALAGGSNVLLQTQVFAGFAKSGFLAPDGHCKAFDAQANGYVRGEGAGIVVLKPLSLALADGDPIYAVIKGGAVNQDGRTNGLTAPSGKAQEAVIRSAYRHAGVSPALVDYVEAHGTGTPLGDPIELAALGAVLGEGRDAGRKCALGSVKTNIGHLEAAAGVAGLIKAALALSHRKIPPSLNFTAPNPHADLDALPLAIARSLAPWPSTDGPARAGVSAFGFGGTNAHIVLEEAPRRSNQALRREVAGPQDEDVVIPLSAQTPEALWDLCRSFRHFLSDAPEELDVCDVAYSAGARRAHHDYRVALVVSSRDEAIAALDCFRRGEPHWSLMQGRRGAGRPAGIAFAFPNADALWFGAGRALFHREPAFQAAIERCDTVLKNHLAWSPADELRADAPSARAGETATDRAMQFTLEVALAALWESWGVLPSRVVGDGVGELAAAYVDGRVSLEDAARSFAGPRPETASFRDSIAKLANEGVEVFLEIGPHPVLASAIKACLGSCNGAPLVLPSLRRGDTGLGTLRASAAWLYARGFEIEWSRVSPTGRFVRLPGYPWQRQRFWLDDEPKLRRSLAEKRPDRAEKQHDQAEKQHDQAKKQHDQIGDKPRMVADTNGPLSGHRAAPFGGDPAPVANHETSVEPAVAIVPDRVISSLADVRSEGLLSSPADVRRQRLVEYFRDRVAAVLGLAADKVDPDRPLLSLGLDSLSAMDLKIELDAALGTKLPLSMLIDASGIRELAERASAHLAGAATQPAPAPVPPEAGESEPRLSHGQHLLWYAHQFTPSPAAYHITGAGRVSAELDVDALRRALRRVIARQDALRTTFIVADEKPAIRLLDSGALALRENEWLRIQDVGDLDDAALSRKLVELARLPFDLENGPLFRIHILSRRASVEAGSVPSTQGPEEHTLLLAVHHVIADFWSTAVLVDDVGKAYADERAGFPSELPAPQFRWADFARWQHANVAGEEGARHWAYWQKQLAGPLPVLDLPTDFARPAVQSYKGAVKHFYLAPTLTRAVVALAQSRGISLYTTLLAAFQLLLGRFTGQDDILVGSPVAGRTRPHLEGLFGYFVNLLPMRADLSGNPSFDGYLSRVRRTVADGLEHQDFPFSVLVSRLQGSPDPSRPPIFQVMYAHQKAPRFDNNGLAPFALGIAGARLNLHGFTVESVALDKETALFDLTLMTASEDDRLCVALEYSTDLFKPSTIDRMADAFRYLLEAVVADPGRRLADFTLLSNFQRQQLTGEWAGGRAIPQEDIGVHHLFERQVELSPDAVALVCAQESLTYRELNRRSNSLARRLLEDGVRPETVVGLYLDRWPLRVIGLLGVLKAGGAYLPLDPDHPAERLAGMIEDSGASLLVTEAHLRGRLPRGPRAVIALDPLAESPAAIEPENPRVRVHGENLSYVVFTSGSTGRPKGVMVSHRSLLAAAAAWEHAYDLRRPPLRHLQAAGFSFDVFTGDWVRALTTGGTLVGCPRHFLVDPAALCDLIRRERIECLELVPALADALATHLERLGEDLGGIRLLAVGSDSLRRRLYRRLCRLVGPGGRVVNSYGLTEATIDSTYFDGPDEHLEGVGPVPIGRPFPGTRTYVLDRRGEPVPPGVLGELFIGGPGVARGYADNPGQTAKRFLPDPHGEPGSRVYATGDCARWRDAGVLELLGRKDAQVKVRGFRVELAEVEATLARHPNVREAVVTVTEDGLGEKRLAAYVVPASDPGPVASDLRRWLKDRLPEPMVPSSYLVLKAIPLSPNGKLDRSALPPPDAANGDGSGTYVPPRTTAEEILAAITAELLGQSRVGVHDNFFEIGVDSIIGIQLVSRARQAGLALDPAYLFRHPNIAELAAATESTPVDHSASDTATPAIQPFELAPEGLDLEAVKRAFADNGGIEDLYPLTPAQQGMLFHTLADPEAGHYVEQFVCRLRGELDLAMLGESSQRLVARHPALRSTIHWTDFNQRFQIVHRRAEQPLHLDDWRELTPSEQEERLASYIEADRKRGFAPSRPPLSRLAVFRLRDDIHQLIWSVHHVVIDGWCLSILLHEMLDTYEAIRRGRDLVLEPSRPFRDYVVWLNRRADERAEAYWRQALRGVTAATPLGIESLLSGRRGLAAEAVAEREIFLPRELTAALQALGRSRRLTLSTLIQGAWALLLSRYSGRSDVLFGVTVSGRPPELSGVESMVGMFINVLPLRVAVTEESNLVSWLRELQSTTVELRRYEAIPLSTIQAWSEVPPATPLVESILIVQNLPFLASLQERGKQLGIEAAQFRERTHYPLAVTVVPGTELLIKIGFDARLFAADAIERVLGHLGALLRAMADDPEIRLADLLSTLDSESAPGQWGRPPDEAAWDIELPDLDRLDEGELDVLLDQLG